MTNPLLKAAGITLYTKNRSAELALFEAAWGCVERIRRVSSGRTGWRRRCCGVALFVQHAADCPLAAFDEAVKFFQEDV